MNGSMNNGSMNGSMNASMNNGQQGATPWNVRTNSNPQPIQNSYHSHANPAAAFQQMQQGSQYGSFIGMQPQHGMGSNRHLASAMQSNGVYNNKQLPNNPCKYIYLYLFRICVKINIFINSRRV